MRTLCAFLGLTFLASSLAAAEKPLQIFFVDVEGGQATLFVSPSGQSLLVDTGWGYNAFRDANRIVAAAKLGRVKKIDYLVLTHFHTDHIGGVPQLAQKMQIGTFVDHGENRETSKAAQSLYSEYKTAMGSANHIVAKPGDKIPIKGLDVTAVSSDGNVLSQPLPGAGAANPYCSGVQEKATDPSENARSLGIVVEFGKLRMLREGRDACIVGYGPILKLAVGPELEGRTGLYFNRLTEARANPQAYDAAARAKLREVSLRLTKLPDDALT